MQSGFPISAMIRRLPDESPTVKQCDCRGAIRARHTRILASQAIACQRQAAMSLCGILHLSGVSRRDGDGKRMSRRRRAAPCRGISLACSYLIGSLGPGEGFRGTLAGPETGRKRSHRRGACGLSPRNVPRHVIFDTARFNLDRAMSWCKFSFGYALSPSIA
jgi:hypothetical protein